jgi:hypothetical protein
MCGAKFIILQARAVLVGIIICFGSPVLALSAAFGLERRLSHHLNSFAMVVVLIVALALTTAAHILITPRFARVRIAANNESADFPLSRQRHAQGI